MGVIAYRDQTYELRKPTQPDLEAAKVFVAAMRESNGLAQHQLERLVASAYWWSISFTGPDFPCYLPDYTEQSEIAIQVLCDYCNI